MASNEVIVRFEKASYEYAVNKPILREVDFTVRRGSKITLMGQNGAGKSTLFGLITKASELESGNMHIAQNLSIAIARQIIPREQLDFTVREFFQSCFSKKIYDIDPRIDSVLKVVNLQVPTAATATKIQDRIIRTFSGGQQARLLLASALIQDPDLLLLDEPTNNLDKQGIEELTKFLVNYKKTVIVISHDADFLNAFTQGVLYLDIFTKKIEQYMGNYFDVVKDISARVEKENRKNAQLAKEIQENKDKANFFANKGGQMRLVARRMREKAEELEEEKVDVRQEDKTIRSFIIPAKIDTTGEIMTITSYSTMKNHKPVKHACTIALRRNTHLLLQGPNGIGKSTLLETLASGTSKGAVIEPSVTVGYYRQDFSMLNFEHTVRESLLEACEHTSGTKTKEETVRSTASGFLIVGDMFETKIKSLSEGQKGLVGFARLVLQRPGLLILDEPTNHINFRHLPVIAEALDKYEGAMILVSHVPEFVKQIRIDETLDLDK